MHDPSQRPPVRIRIDDADIVMTLEPQQAHALARAIQRSSVAPDPWLDEAAQTLATSADQLEPPRVASGRRALRLPGYASVPITPATRSTGKPAAPPPVPPSARRTTTTPPVAATRAARTTRRDTLRTPPRQAKGGGGLAAAVSAFADAISVDKHNQAAPPPPVPPRKVSSRDERAKALQEILEAAAATNQAHAEV